MVSSFKFIFGIDISGTGGKVGEGEELLEEDVVEDVEDEFEDVEDEFEDVEDEFEDEVEFDLLCFLVFRSNNTLSLDELFRSREERVLLDRPNP